jgi:RNA polymerase nonessential primary-like sigma factor
MITTVAEIQTIFEDILDSLPDKEKEVVVRRIGMYGEKETLQEIGKSMNITRERVRQIEDEGIKKM